jgi:hypothetical protein
LILTSDPVRQPGREHFVGRRDLQPADGGLGAEKRDREFLIPRPEGRPLAQVKKTERTSWPCKAGSYRKDGFWMGPDFDAPLDEFAEYMARTCGSRHMDTR